MKTIASKVHAGLSVRSGLRLGSCSDLCAAAYDACMVSGSPETCDNPFQECIYNCSWTSGIAPEAQITMVLPVTPVI